MKNSCTTCNCNEQNDNELSLKKILLSLAFFACAFLAKASFFMREFVEVKEIISLVCFAIAYILVGKNVIKNAIENILHGLIFDENFLMTIASIGAIALGDYAEATAVMLFYALGEFLQEKAETKSRNAISNLMKFYPSHASVKRNGKLETVPVSEVAVGEIIFVKAGERIPLDGRVKSGTSFIDTKIITGEAKPEKVFEGSDVFASNINLTSPLEILVTKLESESEAAKIVSLIENGKENKSAQEKFITKFAKFYTPIVVACAVLLCIIPSVLTGDFKTWIYRSLIFLVVSCPCAIVISVPLTFFSGIGRASKNGILIKGGKTLESLAKSRIAIFDKTGTLTNGDFSVNEISLAKNSFLTEDELLALACHAELFSNHPIAKSLQRAHHCEKCESVKLTNLHEYAGLGIDVLLDGEKIFVGNKMFMKNNEIDFDDTVNESGTIIHIANEKNYYGWIKISDTPKSEIDKMFLQLKKIGIRKTVMLTGDRKENADEFANHFLIDEVRAELLPAEKVFAISEIKKACKKTETIFFVGDGINDAPSLATSDVGIAMGAKGIDITLDAADIVIMDDELLKIADAVSIAKKTLNIAKENIALSLFVKLIIMILGAFGFANMWLAVFGDTGTALLAIANALRVLFWKTKVQKNK